MDDFRIFHTRQDFGDEATFSVYRDGIVIVSSEKANEAFQFNLTSNEFSDLLMMWKKIDWVREIIENKA